MISLKEDLLPLPDPTLALSVKLREVKVQFFSDQCFPPNLRSTLMVSEGCSSQSTTQQKENVKNLTCTIDLLKCVISLLNNT